MGYIDWPEGVASTCLWKEILRQCGFTPPETKSLEVGALYNGQAQGSVDIQTNSWLPATRASCWAKYQDRLEDYGSWYDETSLEIAVPS
ncbi:glycine betaine ABC transporter substrate-binding protein [Streptomyces europaeiscabiei]|nr:glycine betaine ABC transporter substrate-binding protein [Streptomyces europaeiscabiei]MDX3692889.1 glycine betaine ABC transporter substrate-binding protein [Streptomyces europaeiscabiei]